MKPSPQKVITATYKRWLFMKGSNNRGLTENENYYYYYYYYFKVVWIKKKKNPPHRRLVASGCLFQEEAWTF